MQSHRSGQGGLEVQWLQVEMQAPRVESRDVAQVVEEAAKHRELALDCGEHRPVGRIGALLQQAERVGQGAEGIAQLVPESREEIVLAFRRRFRGRDHVFESGHLGPHVSAVPQQFREADVITFIGAQGQEDAADPHAPTALAHVPPVVFGAPELSGDFQFVDVQALGDIFLGEDVTKGLPRQFIRLVAQDANDRRVRGDHLRIEIQEDQREIIALLMPKGEQVRDRVTLQGSILVMTDRHVPSSTDGGVSILACGNRRRALAKRCMPALPIDSNVTLGVHRVPLDHDSGSYMISRTS